MGGGALSSGWGRASVRCQGRQRWVAPGRTARGGEIHLPKLARSSERAIWKEGVLWGPPSGWVVKVGLAGGASTAVQVRQAAPGAVVLAGGAGAAGAVRVTWVSPGLIGRVGRPGR